MVFVTAGGVSSNITVVAAAGGFGWPGDVRAGLLLVEIRSELCVFLFGGRRTSGTFSGQPVDSAAGMTVIFEPVISAVTETVTTILFFFLEPRLRHIPLFYFLPVFSPADFDLDRHRQFHGAGHFLADHLGLRFDAIRGGFENQLIMHLQ